MGAQEIIRSLAALLFVLGLIGALLLVVRRLPLAAWRGRPTDGRRGGRDDARTLDVLEHRRLGPRHQLVRLRWADEERLLLLGPHGDLDLGRRPIVSSPEGEAAVRPVEEKGENGR